MIHQILADYYEEKGFVNKSKRLRRRNVLIVFGYYEQYHYYLGRRHTYGYEHNGNACWFIFGRGEGYSYSILTCGANGWWFR